jgi:hypothetical protein
LARRRYPLDFLQGALELGEDEYIVINKMINVYPGVFATG